MDGVVSSMKVFGLSKRPVPTAVLSIQSLCWRVGERRFAVCRRVRMLGSPMPEFIRSAGVKSAPAERITFPFGARSTTFSCPSRRTVTPVVVRPVRSARRTLVPLWRWKLGRCIIFWR